VQQTLTTEASKDGSASGRPATAHTLPQRRNTKTRILGQHRCNIIKSRSARTCCLAVGGSQTFRFLQCELHQYVLPSAVRVSDMKWTAHRHICTRYQYFLHHRSRRRLNPRHCNTFNVDFKCHNSPSTRYPSAADAISSDSSNAVINDLLHVHYFTK